MRIKWFDWVVGLLVAIVLVSVGTVFWFDFNLVEVISFGMRWLQGVIYTIVAVVGILFLGRWFWMMVSKIR